MRLLGLLAFILPLLSVMNVFANTGERVIAPEVEAMIEDKEYLESVTWMYEQQMTKFVDPIGFMPEHYVTRAQGAKFFVNYATKIAGKTIDTSRYCAFDDLDQSDPSLKNDILQSCLLHLFKGTQGKFFPNEFMTKAQALTVLLRIIDPVALDESGNPRWSDAHARALKQGYTKVPDSMDLDRPLMRYELSLLLWRVKGGGK